MSRFIRQHRILFAALFVASVSLEAQVSFDRIAGSVLDMFDFSGTRMRRLILDPDTGLPVPDP